MTDKQISAANAKAIASIRGMFARETTHGVGLIFYTGQEDNPGSWLEAGRAAIVGGMVSRATVNLITAGRS